MARKEHLQSLVTLAERRLEKLEEKRAIFGIDTSVAILLEIEDTKASICELQDELKRVTEGDSPTIPTSMTGAEFNRLQRDLGRIESRETAYISHDGLKRTAEPAWITVVKIYAPIILLLTVIVSVISFDLFTAAALPSAFIILTAIIICTFPYLIYDFTNFFPTLLEMDVLWDIDGIRQSLSVFSAKELRELHVPSNYETYQKIYYKKLDTDAKRVASSDNFFTLDDAMIHSEGRTTFVVDKLRGIQIYYLRESKGELTHYAVRPGMKAPYFSTIFEKINSDHDYFRPSLIDIFIKRQMILTPIFRQVVTEDYQYNEIINHHILYAVTKIFVLPIPHYGNTVYLYQLKDVGSIPVAYAVYR